MFSALTFGTIFFVHGSVRFEIMSYRKTFYLLLITIHREKKDGIYSVKLLRLSNE